MGLSARFWRVILAFLRKGIGQYELNALPGFTQTASDDNREYLPQPMAKKSPTGTSTDGAVSSSQYILRIDNRQSPVGVIQMCCIAPEPLISARVNVWSGLITTKGFSF